MRQNLVTPNTGEIYITPGYNLACNHVIHTNCSKWHGGTGEQVWDNWNTKEGSVAKWSTRWTRNLAVPGSSLPVATGWICSCRRPRL